MVFRKVGFSMNLQNNKLVRLQLPRHVTNDMNALWCFEIRILNYLDRHEVTLHATCLRWNRQNYKMYDTQQHSCSQIRGSGATRVRCSSSEFIRCPWGEPLETYMVIQGVNYLTRKWANRMWDKHISDHQIRFNELNYLFLTTSCILHCTFIILKMSK